MTFFFPLCNALLNLGAGVSFALKGNWRMTIFYCGLAVANMALAGGK